MTFRRRVAPWAMFMPGLLLFAWQYALGMEPSGPAPSAALLFGGLGLLLGGFVWLMLRVAHRLQSRS